MRRIATALVAMLALGTAAAAHADVTVMDLQIAARALGFMESPPSGAVRLGVVYDPSDSASRRQARLIDEMLAGGMRVGSIELEPVLVSIGSASSADVDVFMLTENLGEAAAGKITALSKAGNVPCVTTDIVHVRAGACALGVRSAPKIEILVNRAAADESGTSFATAFRMMITEL